MQHLVKFHQFVLKILSGNEILTSIKDHNSVINLRKLARNNPNLDLVNKFSICKILSINLAYAKFGQSPSICSDDAERKQNSEMNQGS